MIKFKLDEDAPPPKCEDCEYMYRVRDNFEGTDFTIVKHRIVRKTLMGFWIYTGWGSRRLKWVSATGKNNFAKLTKAEAMENYYFRKLSHVGILSKKLAQVEKLLRLAEIHTNRESKNMFDEI